MSKTRPMAKIGRQKLISSVLLDLKPPPAPQLELWKEPPRRKQRVWKPLEAIPANLSKERVIRVALRNGETIAKSYAADVRKRNGNRVKFSKAVREAKARLFGDMATWKQINGGTKGFVSQRHARSRTSKDRDTGIVRYYKGFDEAVRGLMDQGMTETQVVSVIGVMLNHSDEIRKLDIDFACPGTAAAQFYEKSMKPDLKPIIDEAVQNRGCRKSAIEHSIMFMIYLGIMREIGARKQRERLLLDRAEEESYENKLKRLVMNREDVRWLMGKGVPVDQLIGILYRPSPRVTASFLDSLKPIERKPEPEVALPVAEVIEPEGEPAGRGWKEYVASLFAGVRAFLRNLFGG